jgi:hypothetical protein
MTEVVGPDDLGGSDGWGLQDLHAELKTHTMILGRLEAMEQARERLTACIQAMSARVCALRSIGPSPTPSCEGAAMGEWREGAVEIEALDLFAELEKVETGPMGPGYSGSYLALGGVHVVGSTPHAVPSRVGVYRGDRSSFQQRPESLGDTGWTDEGGSSAWGQQQQRQQAWGAGASEGEDEDGGWGSSAHIETHLRKYSTTVGAQQQQNEHQYQRREYQQPRDAKPRPRGRPPKGSRSSGSAKTTATISKKAAVAASKAHAKAAAKAAKAAEKAMGAEGDGGAGTPRNSKKRPVPSSDEGESFVEEGDDDWDEKRKQKQASKQNDNASIFRGVSRTSRSSWGSKYSSKRICRCGHGGRYCGGAIEHNRLWRVCCFETRVYDMNAFAPRLPVGSSNAKVCLFNQPRNTCLMCSILHVPPLPRPPNKIEPRIASSALPLSYIFPPPVRVLPRRKRRARTIRFSKDRSRRNTSSTRTFARPATSFADRRRRERTG